MHPTNETPDKPRRRWLSFSLRSMLVLLFILCAALAWVGKDLARYRREKTVVDQILACGGRVSYEHQMRQLLEHGPDYEQHPEGNPVFRFVFGDHLYSKVSGVVLPSKHANELIPELYKLPGIEELRLRNFRITSEAMDGLVKMPHLEVLYLEGVEYSLDEFRQLAKSESLRTLSLLGTSVSDEILKQCRHFDRLERIYLHKPKVTNEGIAALGDVTNLRELELNWLPTSISDQGLEPLGQLPNLEKLVIGNAPFGDPTLKAISQLPKMKWLILARGDNPDKITVDGVRHLTSLKQLERLALRDCHIDDQSVVPIETLAKLEYLDLGGNRITDEGLRSLHDLDQLKRLYLLDNPITDEGIKSLQKLESLEELYVTQSDQVTLDQYESFTITKF